MMPDDFLLPAASLARDRIDLAGEGDRRAWIDWSAHVDAGRIGDAAAGPDAPSPVGEVRLASLDRIVGGVAGRGVPGEEVSTPHVGVNGVNLGGARG